VNLCGEEMKHLIPLLFLMLPLSAAAQQHGINVTWAQGTCTPTCTITKNTVYRGTSSAGPFTAIYTSTAPITSYLDPLTTTNGGTQACYVVTAWTAIESNQSTPAICQTFPVQAGAPSSVQASQE
jgi:hypothetical protein